MYAPLLFDLETRRNYDIFYEKLLTFVDILENIIKITILKDVDS